MIKNIIIVVLLVTNGATLYYIYEHMDPEKKVIIETRMESLEPDHYYRIHTRDGGVAEGQGIVRKGDALDLVDKGRVTMTIEKSRIKRIEKVYYSAGKKKKDRS